jgi:hypothetical protein
MIAGLGDAFRRAHRLIWTESFLVAHILIPLSVLSLYSSASSLLLPAGVNRVFVARTAGYVVPIVVVLTIGFFAVHRTRTRLAEGASPSGVRVHASDFVLLLLPLTPVSQYIINSGDILTPGDSILVFALFALLTSLPILVVPLVLRRTGASRPTMYLGMAFAFSITNMAVLSKQFAWHEWGSLKVQLPVLAGLWLLSQLLFQVKARDLMHVAIAIYFGANSLLQIHAREASQISDGEAPTENGLVALIGNREPVAKPSIYLLVYDAYVVNETLLAHGIDNRQQEQYLEGLGFTIYPHTYSVGAATLTTMSRVLNASVDWYDNPRRAVSGDGVVQNLLEEFGYKTYGIFPSDYFFRGISPSYDYSFPGHGSTARLLVGAILEGEFRFDIGFDQVSEDEFVRAKEEILSEAPEEPRFLYSHSELPGHSQFSGACRPDETELFAERLKKANLEIRRDVELVLRNDPDAIVVVAGDHGPYLTRNCFGISDASEEITRLDIQDRFGTFLAIRWPSEEFEDYDDITILQDVFPTIFAYLFEDRGLLEARLESENREKNAISGVTILDGVIWGGRDSGQPLFLGSTERSKDANSNGVDP